MKYPHYDEEDNETMWTIEYTPGYYIPAQIEGPNEKCYPAEGENLSVDKVTDQLGNNITELVSDSEMEQIEEWCEAHHLEHEEDY